MRPDLDIIQQWISANSEVLDLGCGDGELLAYLGREKQVRGLGLEIEHPQIVECVRKGVSVVKQDLNKGLHNFSSQSFDCVVMTQSFQQMDKPDEVLDELLRVGREAIITFPNFAHWSARGYLGLKGRMPMSKALPVMWYNTPNIHLCTFRDFEELCRQRSVKILDRLVVDSLHQSRWFINLMPNLLGEIAIYRLTAL
ncbi:methionine biosynthesis protein MetW [Gynuella sp.]|uniref:methionine biosynthesis protein MetW n=1 Tax=Gynuella sp. TaxID=2969146 RepID=UPI003D09B76B